MASVTFIAPPFEVERVVNIDPQSGATLLTLARQVRWALDKTCGQGLCGSCAVKVVLCKPERADETVILDDEEKVVLYGAGKLTDAEYRAPGLAAHPALWRLACRYVVNDEDIVVFA